MKSLKDIASELDVSISLVSKVLNGRMGTTGVRPELVKSIRDKAAELNYHKNTSAMALLGGRHNVIGTFIHRHGNPGSGVTSSLLRGISTELLQHNQRQILDFFTESEQFLAFRDFMHPSKIDGLIVAGLPHEELEEHLTALQQLGMPIVTANPMEAHPTIPNVGLDEVEVGRLATDHLIQQGCTRIAHIRDFKQRFNGYTQALKDSGIAFDPQLVYHEEKATFTYDEGRRAADYFLTSGITIDGFVAQSDEEAIGAMHVFLDAGKSIPKDIRIVGVDDAPYCKFCRIPLSSISQNGEARGRVSARMLMDLIEGSDEVTSQVIQPILHARASSA